MNRYRTAGCLAALPPAATAITAVRTHAASTEEARIVSALPRAEAAGHTGDPREAATLATLLARLAGHIEARSGIVPSHSFLPPLRGTA